MSGGFIMLVMALLFAGQLFAERIIVAWTLRRLKRSKSGVWLRTAHDDCGMGGLSAEANGRRFDAAQREYEAQAAKPVDESAVEYWPPTDRFGGHWHHEGHR